MRPDRFVQTESHEVQVPARLFGKGLFVHFSFTDSKPEVSLDPVFGDAGPRALYAYPIEHGVHMVFAGDRAYGWVLRPKGRILDSDEYGWSHFEVDSNLLGQILGKPYVDEAMQRWARVTKKGKLRRVYSNLPFGALYYLIAKSRDDDEPMDWTDGTVEDARAAHDVWLALGYCGFVDRHGVVYSSEPVQAAFFGNDCFKPVELLKGKAR